MFTITGISSPVATVGGRRMTTVTVGDDDGNVTFVYNLLYSLHCRLACWVYQCCVCWK